MIVSCETNCTKCGNAKRVNGQRWCRACFTTYMRMWRAKRKVQIAELKALVDKLGRAA